jgi:predicted dehydrogenase
LANQSPRHSVLLIGYGRRGREWHAHLGRRRELATFGVVEPDPSARALAERAGLSTWPTLDNALASGSPGWALVASPPEEHVEQSITCLRHGLAVLVEKPVSLSLEGAHRLSLESSRSGLPVSVVQNFRFLRRERGVRKALASDFGRALSANVVSARPASVAAPHLAHVAHGPLWDICLHHLDALRIRFGRPPDTVEMLVEARAPDAMAGERYTLRLIWRDGPSVLYVHTEGAPAFHHSEWIEGRDSAIVVVDQRVSIARPQRRPRRVHVPRGPEPERAVLDDFLATLDGSGTSSLGIEDNLATVAIVEALLEAETARSAVAPAAVATAAGFGLRAADA